MTSAENQRDGQGAIFVLIDFIARKGCGPTRTRREPIAHWIKASSRRCLVIHSRLQKCRDSGIRKQEDLPSSQQGVEKQFRNGKHRVQAVADGSRTARRLFKKAVQQGCSEKRDDAYSPLYVEPLSEARTKLADFFNSLLSWLFDLRQGQ